jgi:hypothetical protein
VHSCLRIDKMQRVVDGGVGGNIWKCLDLQWR